MKSQIQTITKLILLTLLMIGLLLAFRWWWSSIFASPDHPAVADGVLDLRGWDIDNQPTIPLDGEWEFYPGVLLGSSDFEKTNEIEKTLLQVPGSWNGAWPEDKASAYGSGTYRLRILVDPIEAKPYIETYNLWFQKILASSEVEINGQTVARLGQPSIDSNRYAARAASYTAETSDAKFIRELEILIRVSNFEHPYEGGIVKTVRFGTRSAVESERWYSIGFQLATFLILLLHAVYAAILYFFSRKEKRLLVFSLLLLFCAVSIVSDHDKILLQWIHLDYEWDIKVRLLAYLWMAMLFLVMSRIFLGAKGGWIFRAFTAAFAAYTLFLLAADISLVYATIKFKLFAFMYLFCFALFLRNIALMAVRNDKDSLFLLFAATSIMSSVLWGAFFNIFISNSSMYYPIDIIIAIISFSSYWFKRYFRHSRKNEELTERLLQQDRLKDQFLADTSHELRTPLHGIMNIAQGVADKERAALSPAGAEDLKLLVRISRRMSHLLDDLLDIAQLKEKRIALRPAPLRLQAVGSAVIEMLRYMTDGRPVKLTADIPESIGYVMGDEKRVVQILFNLLHNALKFTSSGQVTLSARREGEYAVIFVSDTGRGMYKETIRRIFLPYEVGGGSDAGGRGIGLGLTISSQLVQLHGSELHVESAPGQGSVFSFRLPLADEDVSALEQERQPLLKDTPSRPNSAAAADETAAAAEPFPAHHPVPDAPSRAVSAPADTFYILAVDDDPVNLKVLANILNDASYRVTTASSAEAALELLHTKRWDLIVSDVMLPDMSGYELTRKIRQRYSLAELPVLLLTARNQSSDIYTGFQSGANDYVTKPVDAAELKYRVWSLASLKNAVDERMRMEAAYLQAQIHPHFLFNALNSIMALSEIDTEKMRKLGEAFTTYLRISYAFLNLDRLVPLHREIELVKSYLYIEKERFEERLTVKWDAEAVNIAHIPPLTLQPLVENAVKHGLLSRESGGLLTIRIQTKPGAVRFEVEDNGIGMEPHKAAQLLCPSTNPEAGIGIANTHRRLVQLYGRGLDIRSAPNQGTTVSFEIPVPDGSSLD